MDPRLTTANTPPAGHARLLQLENAIAQVQWLVVSHLTRTIRDSLKHVDTDATLIDVHWDTVERQARGLLKGKPASLDQLPHWIKGHKAAARTRAVDVFLTVADRTEDSLRYWAPDSIVETDCSYSYLALAAVRKDYEVSAELELEDLHSIQIKLSSLNSPGLGQAWKRRQCTALEDLDLNARLRWEFDLVGGFMSILCVPISEDLSAPVATKLEDNQTPRGVAVVVSPLPKFFNPAITDTVIEALNKHWITGQMAQIQLLQSVRAAVEADTATDDGLKALESRSAACAQFIADVKEFAPSDFPVLLRGEPGTGKEEVACALQQLSRRSMAPFEKVNCGALPRHTLESELFGHEKGSFTGADKKRLGVFAKAHTGTLFLDEVGELPLEVQPAFLRAVQFGEIRPVGSDNTHKVDVRLIAATNQDLENMITLGRFRRDLYDRLKRVQIWLPPLRDRVEDIETLAGQFLAKAAKKDGYSAVPVLQPEALKQLKAEQWDDNIRGLEDAMMRAAWRTKGNPIRLVDLGLPVTLARPKEDPIAPAPKAGPGEVAPAAIPRPAADAAPASRKDSMRRTWSEEDRYAFRAPKVALLVMEILEEVYVDDLVESLVKAFGQLPTYAGAEAKKKMSGRWYPKFFAELIGKLVPRFCPQESLAINAIEDSSTRCNWDLKKTIQTLRKNAKS